MAKYGVKLKIDVSKVDKSKLFQGKKGVYLDATVFLDVDNKDQYDNNGMITQDTGSKEEQGSILGNAQVFWSDSQAQQPKQQNGYQQAKQQAPMQEPEFDDDMPFAPIFKQYRALHNCA